MSQIKIGIVEDEVIIADELEALLVDMGYVCAEPGGSYGAAIAMLLEQRQDLAILDVNLGSKKDGVDIARFIRANMDIPFIFLTTDSDPVTMARARVIRADACLAKPFGKADLYVAIEEAFYNFNHYNKIRIEPMTGAERSLLPETLFIKEGDHFHKVHFDDIIYLGSEQVYVTVHTAHRKFLVHATMQEYLAHFDMSRFVRVHHSYVINIELVEKINAATIIISGMEVPVSNDYRNELLRLLNIVNND